MVYSREFNAGHALTCRFISAVMIGIYGITADYTAIMPTVDADGQKIGKPVMGSQFRRNRLTGKGCSGRSKEKGNGKCNGLRTASERLSGFRIGFFLEDKRKAKMQVYVFKTSAPHDSGKKREFNSLEDCIKTLMKETEVSEFVVSYIKEYYINEDITDCEWLIEIYDYWRE